MVVVVIIGELLLNDSNSAITHTKSTNKHANPRLNVLWAALRAAYERNEFSLRFICGKTLNLADVLTKIKSSLSDVFLRVLRLGKVVIPRF